MAVASGTSRVRLGEHQLTKNARAALQVAEQLGAQARFVDDDVGQYLEVVGVGTTVWPK